MTTHEFTMEGRRVNFTTRRIRVFVLPALNNEFGSLRYNSDFTEGGSEIKRGKLEQIILLNGTRRLVVGGEEVKLDGARPVRSLPDLWDTSGDEWVSIYEKLLQLIVADNPWLYNKQPYSAVFGMYAPEDEESEEETEDQGVEDPTALGEDLGGDLEDETIPDEEEEETPPPAPAPTTKRRKAASSTNGSTSTTDTKETPTREISDDLTVITNQVE